MTSHYDVVVIGAGLGGLTAAALLARAGRKTLLVERNTSVGGAASTYKVGDLVVEAALHETSNPSHPGDPKRGVLERLGILDAVEWVPTGALYEVRGRLFGAPFVLPDNFSDAQAALGSRFPVAREGIVRLLRAMQDAAAGSRSAEKGRAVSLADVFDRELGGEEGAKCALAANLTYFHDDPASFDWRIFAAAQGASLQAGTRFIRGGSQRLSNALRRVIQDAGGKVLLRRTVQSLKLGRDGQPEGVVHTNREGADPVEVSTSTIIGNAAPGILAEMLPQGVRRSFSEAYAARPLSLSVFAATIGLSRPPAEFGLSAYATILFPDWMQSFREFARSAALVAGLPDGPLPVLTIANYAAIDSGLGGPPYVVSVLGPDRIENWEGLSGLDYGKRREQVLDAIVAAMEREFPGFAHSVVMRSLNTARSMNSYLNAPRGAICGFAPIPGSAPGAPGRARTPVPGIYLASAYSHSGGFNGAILGGAAAADAVLADAPLFAAAE